MSDEISEITALDVEPIFFESTAAHENEQQRDAIERTQQVYQQSLEEKKPISSHKLSNQVEPISDPKSLSNIRNVAADILDFGIKGLNVLDAEMHAISDNIEKINAQSKQIVDLQKKFAKLSDQTSVPITDEMRKDFEALKALGVDILPSDATEISPDLLSRMKTALDSIKTQFQTETQKNFMKIQHASQKSNSIIDSLKLILRQYANLISTIIQHMSR
ncbi:MAG: hypothetical protein Q8L98_00090 [Chlamydiales bacterium]|nr:hypothetical protein [Chlamydiales bacterium]